MLILGSIPGIESLRKKEYYGHERNDFWRIMYYLLNEEYVSDYSERVRFLIKHGIALWDVVKSCEREGSADTNIKHPVVNDFNGFFSSYPRIRHVFFNGRAAYKLFRKYIGFYFESGITFTYLRSTSPAYAAVFERKISDWRAILTVLNNSPDKTKLLN